MPEHFNVSLIAERSDTFEVDLKDCFKKYSSFEKGESRTELFGVREVIVSYFTYEDTDFDEIFISFSEKIFHKEFFEEELIPITFLVDNLFICYNKIHFALCSYELNGYLLDNVKKIADLNDSILNKFPIIYRRNEGVLPPLLSINLKAQDIFNP